MLYSVLGKINALQAYNTLSNLFLRKKLKAFWETGIDFIVKRQVEGELLRSYWSEK